MFDFVFIVAVHCSSVLKCQLGSGRVPKCKNVLGKIVPTNLREYEKKTTNSQINLKKKPNQAQSFMRSIKPNRSCNPSSPIVHVIHQAHHNLPPLPQLQGNRHPKLVITSTILHRHDEHLLIQIHKASLLLEKIDCFRGFIERFSLFSNQSEDHKNSSKDRLFSRIYREIQSFFEPK